MGDPSPRGACTTGSEPRVQRIEGTSYRYAVAVSGREAKRAHTCLAQATKLLRNLRRQGIDLRVAGATRPVHYRPCP